MNKDDLIGGLVSTTTVFGSTLAATYCQPQITSMFDSSMESTPVGSNGTLCTSLGGSVTLTLSQLGELGTVDPNPPTNYGPGRDPKGYYDSSYGIVTKNGDEYIIQSGDGKSYVADGNKMSYQQRRYFDEQIKRNNGVFKVMNFEENGGTLNQKNYDAVDCNAERIHDMLTGDNDIGKGMIIAKDQETAEVLKDIKESQETDEIIVVLKTYKEILEKELEGNSKKYIKKRESR